MNLVAEGDEQEPLLGGGIPDGQEVGLLSDLVNRAVDVVDRHLGDLTGAHIKKNKKKKHTHTHSHKTHIHTTHTHTYTVQRTACT